MSDWNPEHREQAMRGLHERLKQMGDYHNWKAAGAVYEHHARMATTTLDAAQRLKEMEAALRARDERIAELEAALREIAAHDPESDLGIWLYGCDAPGIARAALAGEEQK